MGCSVINFLHQLDISLVEICFIYTLKLGIRGWLSMSAHNPRLQFVTELPDSPKSKAKGVVVVRGPWNETPGYLGSHLTRTSPSLSQVCLCSVRLSLF